MTSDDPFTTRRRQFKNFKHNFLEFWDRLVAEAQDNETLVNNDPFEELITYITCFAQCVRPRSVRLQDTRCLQKRGAVPTSMR